MANEQQEQDQPDQADLLWTGRKPMPRGRKPGLSLALIVRSAIELADAEGIATFSMQRLATALGAGAMSLYRYVPSKEDLVALMLDAAIDAPSRAAAGTGWRPALQQWAHQGLAVFQRHPWTLSLVATPRVMGPNETAHLEEGLRSVSEMGLTPAEMLNTVVLVNGYVRGCAPFAIASQPETAENPPHASTISIDLLDRYGKKDEFPNVARVMKAASQPRRRKPADQFDYGLQRILDGIEAYLAEKARRGAKRGSRR